MNYDDVTVFNVNYISDLMRVVDVLVSLGYKKFNTENFFKEYNGGRCVTVNPPRCYIYDGDEQKIVYKADEGKFYKVIPKSGTDYEEICIGITDELENVICLYLK